MQTEIGNYQVLRVHCVISGFATPKAFLHVEIEPSGCKTGVTASKSRTKCFSDPSNPSFLQQVIDENSLASLG